MSSGKSEQHVPEWLCDLLGGTLPQQEGVTTEVGGRKIVLRGGILRAELPPSETQKQTQESFGFIWS
jgi:hypothetical protein